MHLPDFSKTRILVIGDVMLDRYWHGKTSRISPEAPVPVVQLSHLEERPGGASNVALNLASLGCQTTLLGLTGQDKEAETLTKLLTQHQISCVFEHCKNRHTITKSRVVSHHQQLMRLDIDDVFSSTEAIELLPQFEKHLADCDVVIISDYAKGIQTIVPQLIQIAKQKQIPVLVDPKNKDLSIYKNATIITPNFTEFEVAVGHFASDQELVTKGTQLIQNNNWQALLVTRGEHGMSLLQKNQPAFHIPTDAKEVFDVTGAGDTVIAVLGAACGAGFSLSEATVLANKAAGIVVSKVGTATVSPEELQAVLSPPSKLFTLDLLLKKIELLRQQKKTIVMTNGCFDILHAGHVTYLEQAKQLGSYLIVAVNDDLSVRRLKGTSRPINTLNLRMTVLAGLAAPDAIISFSENTPEQLVQKINPNILVKGGDWQVNQIAGSEWVLAHGGRVETIPLVPGCSTTKIIESIV